MEKNVAVHRNVDTLVDENIETMLSARIHEYQEPLEIDTVSKPKIAHGEEVLVRVGAAGLILHNIGRSKKNRS